MEQNVIILFFLSQITNVKYCNNSYIAFYRRLNNISLTTYLLRIADEYNTAYCK